MMLSNLFNSKETPMAKLRRRSLLLLLLLLLLPLGFPAAGDSVSRKDGGAGVVAGGELWCVAKNNAEDAVLQAGLDWACGPGRSDCGPVQPGGPCFEPDDLQSHASYAFNDYFLRHGSSQPACDFSGAAALTLLNPSHGDCKVPSSSSAANGSFSGSSTAGLGPIGTDTNSGGCQSLALSPAALGAATNAIICTLLL